MEDEPAITFGFRGEDVQYRIGGRRVWTGFTWMLGPRLYPDGNVQWTGGCALTDEEKTRVFEDVLRFVAEEEEEKPIVVINVDDALRVLWEDVCSAHSGLVQRVEYTSDEERYASERESLLGSLHSVGPSMRQTLQMR